MAIVFHKLAETPHLNVYVGTVVVDRTKCPRFEMGSVGVDLKFGTPLQRTDGMRTVAGSTTQKLTPLTLKSYPQTWHPGAFSKSSASKEDSPFMPEARVKENPRIRNDESQFRKAIKRCVLPNE
jgi:hypothetical protein